MKAEIAGLAGESGARINVVDAEEYDGETRLPTESLVLFLMATYGDGEPTDNAADLYNWVVRSAGDAEFAATKPLAPVTYAVFGLGNKQYEHFCAVGKRLHKALEGLGGAPIVLRGDGDDDDDIEGDFDAWKAGLLTALKDRPDLLGGGGADGAAADACSAPLPAFTVTPAPAGATPAPRAAGTGTSPHSPALATITAVRELHTPASDRSCVHVELDCGGTEAVYTAGDHVGVVPSNDDAVVAELASLLAIDDPSSLVTFDPPTDAASAADIGHPVPGPLTLRDALAWHADVLSPIGKPTLAAFARAATGDEATALAALLTPDAAAAYKSWHAHSRCLLEVMREFPATARALGVGAFFGGVAPRLGVRFYSISSSPAASSPTTLTVTAAVVRETTATGRTHRGPASNGLAAAKKGGRVAFFIRRSTFRLPSDPATPIIMVGPGTGLAPFRGFLQDRAATAAGGGRLGEAVLFFGCRSKRTDCIYSNELAQFQATGALTTLHVAFSRDGPTKDYVQHHIAANGASVKALVDAGAYVYVCGDAKAMARDVHATLRDVLGGGSAAAGDAALKVLADGGRYHKDVW